MPTAQSYHLQVVKGQIWCFQQPQNLAGSNVHTNVRMTAVKLRSGGLLIYAPIAATRCALVFHLQFRAPQPWLLFL